jgi:hypothetical protein
MGRRVFDTKGSSLAYVSQPGGTDFLFEPILLLSSARSATRYVTLSVTHVLQVQATILA